MKNDKLEDILYQLKSNPELWDIFTRREEYSPTFRDRYGRFPYYLSNDRNIFDPIISKYLVDRGLRIEYPDGKDFAVCLTHDIDVLYHSKMATIIDTGRDLIHGQMKKAIQKPFYNIYKNWNSWWNFQEIMNLEDKYDAKSTFFIMALEKSDPDFNYTVTDISNDLGIILDRGWEVGLHGNQEAYNNLKMLKIQKANLERGLGRKIAGYRNHFLRFKIPETWKILEEAKFCYDATLGYSDSVGFRNGMCHPFRPFNLNTNEYINLCEIPLAIMDTTLFDSYMKMDMSTAWKITVQLINTVCKYNGVINILWHNNSFAGEKLTFYEKILEYCFKKNAWLCCGDHIYKYIKNSN